ncbi:type III secretion system outer membrane ring subunit SctC [Endozoicomonas sp. SM1973]|uniref:Type 3 secretion system secretin n=1 Tax=Spartinivicinus marinus TaxID=2994442 RepID=A0A853I8V2_9GAMM|nr:type III secretion system outer membrane ring subunit SctC [Spartinivicinus marinus]MCX4024662.1 type III secretion system outer membrane ring subunit SctC [Spartinivicinus marinus]NYZ66311.1 type III secretion system outer membrane ring subunit SctC [Spartinivicinus marinus]
MQLSRLYSKVLILAWIAWYPGTVFSAQPNWSGKPFSYVARGQSLGEILTSFASSYSIPVVISEAVDDTVNGELKQDTPIAFLDYLAKVYNLTWYFDGHILYIYKTNETKSKLIKLTSFLDASQLKRYLDKLGIWDRRFNWRVIPSKDLVYVAGPPRYVELVSETVAALEKKIVNQQQDQMVVEVFPLKYAWAVDREYSFRGKQVVMPGIATILNQMIRGNQPPKSNTTNDAYGLTKLKGQGLVKSAPHQSSTSPTNPTADTSGLPAAMQGPTIEADPRQNAVLIRDVRAQMPIYQDLIRKLDQPQGQVEIGLSIIDISRSDIDELGINWYAQKRSGDGIFEVVTQPRTSQPVSTLLTQGSDFFLAKIRLLAEDGKAQVLSQPTVLTLNNVEAVFDQSTTFYVRLAGQEEVDLVPVTVGTVLKVTPRIVSERGANRVHMDINIEDGNQTDDQVDSIPTTQKATISTQAVVGEQQSLLIGGLYRDSEEQTENKVPVLGDIPFIGALFRSTEKTKRKIVRLFLIQPRIVADPLKVANELTQNAMALSQLPSINQRLSANRAVPDAGFCHSKKSAQAILNALKRQQIKVHTEVCYLTNGQSGFYIKPVQQGTL